MKVSRSHSDTAVRRATGDPPLLPDIPTADFEKSLQRAMVRVAQDGSVSEEELFSAVTDVLVGFAGGKEASSLFRSVRTITLDSLRDVQRSPSQEMSASKALRFLEKSGAISASQKDEIRSIAVRISQLDRSREIYDRIGGPEDPTFAVARIGRAKRSVLQLFQDVRGDVGRVEAQRKSAL